jgi:hypothetical protein
MLLIQETFAVKDNDKRKPLNAATIDFILKACEKLDKRGQYLSKKDVQDARSVIECLKNCV